jgi:hypothetical protein
LKPLEDEHVEAHLPERRPRDGAAADVYSILVRFTTSPVAARMASTCRLTSSSWMDWKKRILEKARGGSTGKASEAAVELEKCYLGGWVRR